jgi:hypothetical protein
VSKPEFEFFPSADVAWTPVPGKVPGLEERILARDPHSNVATRMLRFQPGADTSPNGVLTHDFWEEIYILEGSIYDLRHHTGPEFYGRDVRLPPARNEARSLEIPGRLRHF